MSWEQLLSIAAENRADRETDRQVPPTACPNDGTPLRTGGDGRLFCPFDGWRPA